MFLQTEDRDEAIMTLELLRDDGRPLPEGDIEAWALGHAWPPKGVDNFLKLLKGVQQRKKLRVSNRWMGPDAITRWKQNAASAEDEEPSQRIPRRREPQTYLALIGFGPIRRP